MSLCTLVPGDCPCCAEVTRRLGEVGQSVKFDRPDQSSNQPTCRSALKGFGEARKGDAHGPTISLRSVIHTRGLPAELHDGLGPQVLIPFGHTASRLGRLDAISPGRVMEVHHRALKCECPARVGFDYLALRGPLVFSV